MKRFFARLNKANKVATVWLTTITLIIAVWVAYKSWRTKDVSGRWHITFKVEKSDYIPYIGEIHKQEVFFIQNEKEISGDGEKIEYNGNPLPTHQHRKLEYKGTISGRDFKAAYVLHGEKRESIGDIIVRISWDGESMEGTFSGTAGNSTGSITGEKMD